jgi:hypothetical protein
MVSAYAVRKLAEAGKLSTRFEARRFTVGVHKLTGKVPDMWSKYAFWELFDVESRQKSEMDLATLYHEIIHSYIFVLNFSETSELIGIFVCSDRSRRRQLYSVSLDTLILIFDHVGTEDIVRSEGWTPDGERNWTIKVSQHDLVEDGLARYTDDSRLWIDRLERPTI